MNIAMLYLFRRTFSPVKMNDSDVVGLLMEAVNFAAIKHKNQRRKDYDKTPYINHPIGVAYSIWKEGGVTDPVVLQVTEILVS